METVLYPKLPSIYPGVPEAYSAAARPPARMYVRTYARTFFTGRASQSFHLTWVCLCACVRVCVCVPTYVIYVNVMRGEYHLKRARGHTYMKSCWRAYDRRMHASEIRRAYTAFQNRPDCQNILLTVRVTFPEG
jgi:hypothetical protein